MEPRHCGKAVHNKVYITGKNWRQWPDDEAPFSYTPSTGGVIRSGNQKMKPGLLTTEIQHQVGCYYPKKGTKEAARVLSIERDWARVQVEYEGRDTVAMQQPTMCPLSSLLLVNEYTTIYGKPQTTQSSSVPKLTSTPPRTPPRKGSPRKAPIRGDTTTAIAVGHIHVIYPKLVELSADYNEAVNLAVTHKGNNSFVLRTYNNTSELSEDFFAQGVMDGDGQGLSCGVEAVNNAGFKVTAASFSQWAADGLDAREFMVKEDRPRNHDDYIDNTGGGNNIPYHQMFLTMKNLAEEQGLEMDESPHLARHAIGTPEFWVDHKWAIVQIPVCGGHWVSMEKIMYKDQPAICLREGRGKVMYDFITQPGNVSRERLPGATGKKRKI